MTCHEIQSILPLLVSGELTGEEKAPVDLHLQACTTCSREAAAMRQLWSRLQETPPLEPSNSTLQNIRQHARDAATARDGSLFDFWRAVRIPQWVSAAVACALLIAILTVFFKQDQMPTQPPIPTATLTEPDHFWAKARALEQEIQLASLGVRQINGENYEPFRWMTDQLSRGIEEAQSSQY